MDLTKCLQCNQGETSEVGAKSCQSCSIGQYGQRPGECSECPTGQFQSEKKQIVCLECENGGSPNQQKTACEKADHQVKEDCDYNKQYLNSSSANKDDWVCESCPRGAYCKGDIDWTEVVALQGWWRVPWSENNKTFQRCPFQDDCRGARLTDDDTTTLNITEGCDSKTTGPLCSICIEGYNRDGSQCTLCDDSSVPMRVSILLSIIAVMFAIVMYCRRKVKKKWQMFRPLWRDFLRVVSINITFAQINSSLPYVLEVQWVSDRVVFNFVLFFLIYSHLHFYSYSHQQQKQTATRMAQVCL
jgi:hypothetical protein